MKKTTNSGLLKYSLTLLLLSIASLIHAQQDYYWVGGSGNWSDYANHWATTSGGSVFHTAIPTDQDNVFFDENSFTAEDQVVYLGDYYDCHDMNWTGALFNPTIDFSDESFQGITISGSVTFIKEMKLLAEYLWIGPRSEPGSLTTNGLSLNETDLTIGLDDNSFALLDSISVKSFSTIGNFSEFKTNGHPIHALESFYLASTIFHRLDLSGSRIYTKSVTLNSSISNNGTTFLGELITDNVTIEIIYPGGTTEIDKSRIITPFGENFIVRENHQILNKDAIFKNLTIDPGVELLIDDAVTGIEFETLEAKGTENNRITIKSDNPGTAATLIQNTGEVNVEWANLQDISGTGGATYNAFASVNNGNVSGFTFSKLDQTIDVTLEQKNYEDVDEVYVPVVSATSGLEVTLQSGDPLVAEEVNGNELLIKGVGTTSITATQSGNEFYNAADPVVIDFEVTKANQIISMDIPDTWIGEGFLNLNASSSSNLDVTYGVVGPAQLNGSTLVFTGVGNVLVTASQSGNGNYFAADDVQVIFNVFKKDNVISFSSIPDTWIGDERVNINASTSSDLPLSYQVDGPATVNGNVLTFTGTGTVQVTAKQAGNENYTAADDVIRSFEVFKKSQTITFSEIADTSEDAGFLNLDASSDSGLPVSYSVVGPVEVVNGVLEFTGSGMVQVTAIQSGNDLYLAAEEVKRAFEIASSVTEKPLTFHQPEGLAVVYPNPVTEFLYFDTQMKIESVQISDLSGRIFYQGTLPEDQLDMSGYDSGIYLLTIEQSNGEKVTQRIKVN